LFATFLYPEKQEKVTPNMQDIADYYFLYAFWLGGEIKKLANQKL